MLEKEISHKAPQQAIINNPFPGLRPFSIDESHLFFGREGQSDEVLLKLANHRFVGVIGPSGSGKSSFIYCGVLPILYGGFLAHKGSDWNVMVMRPGGGPIDNLADSILREDPNFIVADKEEKIIRKTITTTLLKSSSLGLVEALTQSKRNKNKNFLLLVDQFEELFRFQKADLNNAESLNEALAFVNLLSETVNQKEIPVYVAITMRSDFIGDCAQFPDLTSLINDSHYLIPQMTREQKRTAILGPVAVGDGKIAPRLVQQLLNDLGDKADQLPILQHALMRTWDYWAKTREGDEPMDLLHYEAIGSMSEALSQHANEAYDELDDEQRRICESIFRSITLKRGEADGIRRPTRISELAAIADTSIDEVIMVVEKFREPGRSLLTPPPHINLNANSVVDISHESLMRIWVRLKNWVEDEGASVQMYMRLAEAGAMYQIGKAGLWRQPDLQMALNWQQKQKPTLIWGQRYDLAYERTMVFLENSKQEYETEQRAKDLEQKRALRRSRIVAITLGSAAVICLVMLLFAFLQLTNTKRQKEIADKATVQANSEKQKAEKLKVQADKAAKEANAQAEAAKIAKANAENSALAASLASEEAKRSEQRALSQKEAADRAKKEAEGARFEAESNKTFAEEQAALAQEQSKKAQKLRMLSISQSMSVKSIQMQEDNDLKGLLAVQSYQYNKEFEGHPYSSDVYNALYYSLKSLKGDSVHRLWGHTDQVRSIAFSNDGQWMYSAGSDGKIFRWKSGQTTNPEIIASNPYVNKVLGISPDNKWLVCAGENGNIQLFDLTQNEIRPRLLVGHIGEITDLVFLPDSKGFVSTATDKKVMLCDFSTFTTLATLESIGRSLSINSHSNQLAIGSSNGRLLTMNLNNQEEKPITIYTAPSAIWSVLYSPDGKQLAFGDEKGALRVWSTQVHALGKTFSGHTQRINDLAYTSDSKMLASASYDGSARIIVLSHPDEQPIVLRDHPSWVWTLAFDRKNENLFTASKATATQEHSFRYWPLNMGSLSAEICEKLKRNMNDLEWDQYVGADIDYVYTCQGLPKPSSSK